VLAQRFRYRAAAIVHVQRRVDVAHVTIDGMRAEEQLFGDLHFGAALDQLVQDLTLTIGETVIAVRYAR
jgi:hypothetical protein